jgi:hypothetical protein
MPFSSQRVITGALKFGLIEKVGEVRIGVNDADEFGYRTRARPPPSCSAWGSTAGKLPAAQRCIASVGRVRTLTYGQDGRRGRQLASGTVDRGDHRSLKRIELVQPVMHDRGYPVDEGLDQRAAVISVMHADFVED